MKKLHTQGQHDEEGWVIEISPGLLIKTPSIYEVARAMGKSHHDSEVWQRYNAIADELVARKTPPTWPRFYDGGSDRAGWRTLKVDSGPGADETEWVRVPLSVMKEIFKLQEALRG